MYRKTLATLLDESVSFDLFLLPQPPNIKRLHSLQNLASQPKSNHSYITAVAPPSQFPPLILCSVCGYNGNYSCRRCGLKYCDMGCQQVHDETRCERR